MRRRRPQPVLGAFGCLLLWLLAVGGASAQNGFQRTPDGGYRGTTPNYTADIAPNGTLANIEVGRARWLKEPFWYGDSRGLPLPPMTLQRTNAELPAPDTLVVTLAPPQGATDKPAATITYRLLPNELRMTLNRLAEGSGTLQWKFADSVVGVESLARPGFGYARLPGNGLVYALPQKTQRSGLRDLRYYFQNGRALDVYYRLADAGLNFQANGVLQGDAWTRGLIGRGAIEFVFAPVRTNQGGTPNAAPALRALPAALRRGVSYTLRPVAPDGFVPAGEKVALELQFAQKDALPAAQTLEYRLQDFWDQPVASGRVAVPAESGRTGAFRFEVAVAGTGWFKLITTLRPADAPTALPAQDECEFGVFRPAPALTNPPVPTNSAPALTAALGLKCFRYTLPLIRWFPDAAQSPMEATNYDWKKLDEEMQRNAGECAKWNIVGLCQLIRPKWANPAQYEALVRQVVARYKAQAQHWEMENEPNAGYTPESYVAQALAPGYRGAKAADRAATVLGPAIVRVDLKWLDRFFLAEGGQYLDAVSVHTYTGHNRSWEENGNPELLERLRRRMQEAGIGEKPLWMTEHGYTFNNHAEMPRLQAAYVVRMFALAASKGVPTERCYYFYTERHGYRPFYLFDTAPNRAGMAARVLAEQTAGMRFDRTLNLGKYAHGVVYTNGRQDTYVLWTNDFEATLRVRADATLTAQNLMGGKLALPAPQSGVWKLPLSGFPVYVRLPRGAEFQPLDRFPEGENWALAAKGGVAEASSYADRRTDPAPLNDGVSVFDDGVNFSRLWVADKSAALPQWAQVTFDQPRRLHTLVAVAPSSNVALPGIARYQLQVRAAQGWRTVREGVGNRTEWTLYARFAPVTATAARIVIQEINNGWWWDDKTPYTDGAARIYELEAYGEP